MGDCGRTKEPGRVVGSEPLLNLGATSEAPIATELKEKDSDGGRGECGTEELENDDLDPAVGIKDVSIVGIEPTVFDASEGRPPLSRHFSGRFIKLRLLLDPSISLSPSGTGRYAVGGTSG